MLIEHPLFMTGITIAIFRIGEIIHAKSGGVPFLNPVILSIAAIISLLMVFDISYSRYFSGTEMLHFLLAPAIVVLAVPLYQNLKKAKALLPIILGTVVIAGTGIIFSAVVIGQLAGLPDLMLLALTTKSVSAPVALAIADVSEATTALTIVGVFSTGLTGVIIVPSLLKVMRVNDEAIQGLILGITAHAFGISRALSISPLAAAFATMGMGLMGCFAVIAIPVFLPLLGL